MSVTTLSDGIVSWFIHVWSTREDDILRHAGLESILFLRYLRLCILIFGVPSVLLTPVIIGICHSGGVARGVSGIDRLGWPNIQPNDIRRLWAFAASLVAFVLYTHAMIDRELQTINAIRQTFLASSQQTGSIVLLSQVPSNLSDENSLKSYFKQWAHLMTNFYVVRDPRQLRKLIQKRDKLLEELESTEINFVRQRVLKRGHSVERPQIRLIQLPQPSQLFFRGPSVDKLQHLRRAVANLNKSILTLQGSTVQTKVKASTSILIHLSDSVAAQCMSSTPASSDPNKMNLRYLGDSPQEIVYDHLGLGRNEEQIRRFVAWQLNLSLILLWTVPIALTAALSQLQALATAISIEDAISHWPSWVLGILQGVLPSLALSMLMMLFPRLLRLVVHWRRLPSTLEIELTVQRMYFIFLFTQLFLTASISSGIIAVLAQAVNNITHIPAILAQNLPKAGNYYLTYIMTQAFLFSALTMLQPYRLYRQLMHNTKTMSPRRQAECQRDMEKPQWGTVYPLYSTIACISALSTLVVRKRMLIRDSDYLFVVVTFDFAYCYYGLHDFLVLPSIPVDLRCTFSRRHGRQSVLRSSVTAIHRAVCPRALLHRPLSTEGSWSQMATRIGPNLRRDHPVDLYNPTSSLSCGTLSSTLPTEGARSGSTRLVVFDDAGSDQDNQQKSRID